MKEDLKYVVDNSKYVSIDYSNLDNFIDDLGETNYIHWSKSLNLNLNEKEWILLSFIIESMNFCFWQKPKWKIKYKDEILTGSNAMFFSIISCVEDNTSFLDIEYLDKIDKESFINILSGLDGNISLIEERYNSFKEIINYIKNNDFYGEIFSIKSDIELLKYITDHFKFFDDKSVYKNRLIHFNKRATLLVNDLYQVSSTIKNNIGNVNNLGGCADYGIPRTFRDYQILVYADQLKEKIDNEIEIPHDSEMEIEIRGNMLYVIELIKEKLKDKGIIINSVELDNIIWLMGKKMSNRSNSHHTVTIFY